jgi:hypothetical protein
VLTPVALFCADAVENEQALSYFNAAQGFDEKRSASCPQISLGTARERFDALSCADEGSHDEDADRKQHGLQDVGAGVIEA